MYLQHLTKQFIQKMKLLTVVIALLSAITPFTYFFFEHQDGKERAFFYAILWCLFTSIGLVIAGFIRKVNTLMGQLAEANTHLAQFSITDEKTGLFNATASVMELQKALDRDCQLGGLCVLLINVDYFKKYNDRYGHLQGDEALIQLAAVLKSNVYPTDIIGRFGGEEFIVIMPRTTDVEGEGRAERIRTAVTHSHFAGEEYMTNGILSISIGLAYNADGAVTPQELIKQADEALYWAKETGRNNTRQYSKLKRAIEMPSQLDMAVGLPSMKQEMTDKVLGKFIEDVNSYMLEVYEPTVRCLLKALEIWEVETVKHSLRVNRIALEIGKELELSAEELLNLNLGTLLHDIGKLSIGDSVLLKEQPLTPEEYCLIQKHPQAGYDMVKDNECLSKATKAILYHHERFDGKGYPHGLAGADIPLLARICSVADAFEAMTSDRPYKKSISLKDAAKEISRNSGSQFDPQVVVAFLKICEVQLDNNWSSAKA